MVHVRENIPNRLQWLICRAMYTCVLCLEICTQYDKTIIFTISFTLQGKPLPPVLYLQADNCFRENKNKFVLALLELLVHKEVFYEVGS